MSRNPALSTKVKALKSNLLSQEDYNELISCETLEEVITYLKDKTQYSKYLRDLDPKTTSRTIIEGLLNQLVIENTTKLLYFINGAERDFIDLIIKQINLTSLLVILRTLLQHQDPNQYLRRLAFSKKYNQEKFYSLIENNTWASYKNALRNSIYYRSIQTYDDVNQQDIFELEKTMERAYYDYEFKQLNKLNEKENASIIKLLRIEIDLLNLIWIYRAKKFYHFGADLIIPYIYRGGLKLNEDFLRSLAEIDNYEDLLAELKKIQPYNFLFDHSEKDIDLYMDRRKRRYMHFQFKELIFFGNAITSSYSYLRLLEDEIHDLISIIEAKRYNLTKEETIDYLINYND